MFDNQVFNLCTVFSISTDASYGSNFDTCQSSQRYEFLLFNGMIDWETSREKTVTTSSTEAELLAIPSAAKKSTWWSQLFDNISFDLRHKTYIQCYNAQTIWALTTNTPRFITKLRHVDIHNH